MRQRNKATETYRDIQKLVGGQIEIETETDTARDRTYLNGHTHVQKEA